MRIAKLGEEHAFYIDDHRLDMFQLPKVSQFNFCVNGYCYDVVSFFGIFFDIFPNIIKLRIHNMASSLVPSILNGTPNLNHVTILSITSPHYHRQNSMSHYYQRFPKLSMIHLRPLSEKDIKRIVTRIKKYARISVSTGKQFRGHF